MNMFYFAFGQKDKKYLISGKVLRENCAEKDPGKGPQVAQVARQRKRDLSITALSKCNTKED